MCDWRILIGGISKPFSQENREQNTVRSSIHATACTGNNNNNNNYCQWTQFQSKASKLELTRIEQVVYLIENFSQTHRTFQFYVDCTLIPLTFWIFKETKSLFPKPPFFAKLYKARISDLWTQSCNISCWWHLLIRGNLLPTCIFNGKPYQFGHLK